MRPLFAAAAVLILGLLAPRVVSADPAPAPTPTPNPSVAIQKAIDDGNAKYIAAWEKGDSVAFAALFAPNADRVGSDGAVLRGRGAIQDLQKRTFAKVIMSKGTITTTDLVVDGDVAYEIGMYDFTFKPTTGKDEVDTGRYLTIWAKQPDGTWRIIMDSGLQNDPCKAKS
jgi:uncharacterized protein (TIGR02246 family)